MSQAVMLLGLVAAWFDVQQIHLMGGLDPDVLR